MEVRFNSAKESYYLQYLDANNLYGLGNEPKPSNPEKSYLLEVSMSYPNGLHDQHNDFPFMCEKRKINGVQKLVHNLYDKKKCVINIVSLDQAFKHRLVLDKVHQVH